MPTVLIISMLVMVAIFAAMIAVHRWLGWTRIVEARLAASLTPVAGEMGSRAKFSDQVNKRLSRMTFGERLERQLTAANSNMSVGEFVMMRVGIALGAFVLGWLLARQPIAGLFLAGLGWMVPGMWLGGKQSKRAKAFADQLPDMLTMLIGSLRAGYGLLYAITVIEKEMPEPIAAEFGRVVRETALGYSITDALDHLVDRMQNDDLALIVTAILIQNEVGGSLAEVLETIPRTIRERIQLKGQIRSITAQQRMTGSVLSGMPIIVGGVLFVISPDYMNGLFQPGWPLLIPIGAMGMVICGNVLMRKLLQIDV